MTDEVHGGDDGSVQDGARPAPAARRWWVVAAALALAAAMAVAVLQTVRLDDFDDDREAVRAARQARSAAGAFGEAYLTYDAADVEGSGRRVLALTTDRFARDFEATQVPGLQELFANVQTTTEATVTEVFLGDVDDRAARALVVVDVTATSTATGTQVLTGLSFVVDLVDEDGRWLVDDVAPAPRAEVVGGRDPGAPAPDPEAGPGGEVP